MDTVFSNVSPQKKIAFRLHAIVLAIMFWMAKKWNKRNKFLNFWLRSNKDLTTNGVCASPVVDMSKDGRARIRYNEWVIYVGYSKK